MGKIIDKIYKYFSDESVPLSRKLKIIILVLLVIVLVDNHYGFTHTIINSYKVDYITKLESAKKQFSDDTLFVKKIDGLIKAEHKRKGVVEKFYPLLQEKVNDNQKGSRERLYYKILNERDPFIHTLSGAYIPFVLMIASLLAILISIFSPMKRSFDIFFWAVIILLLSGAITYHVSLSWAKIDPIFGQVWINYIIQFIVNIIFLILLHKLIEIYERDNNSSKENEDIGEETPKKEGNNT